MTTPYKETPEGTILAVRAQPRSSRPGIERLPDGEAVKIRIRSAPVDGKANKELIETIADIFGIAKSRVTIKSGETSKTKRVLLAGLAGSDVEKTITKEAK